MLLSPAILWGILISECDGESRRDEANEAENGWLDAASREVETDEDPRDAESDGYTEESPAEPGARALKLWGFRQTETSSKATNNDTYLSKVELLDREATTKLWIAAGYNVELPTEGSGATPAVRDATLINDDDGEPTEAYQPPSGPYNIKEAHGKGQGVYASQDFPRGTRILVDKPFFVVFKPYSLSTILTKFEHMSSTRRRLYMQLSCPDRPDDRQMSDVTRIFEANCFNIDYSAAIFQTATRFNHACLPNTYYSWSEARQELVFQAMIDVKKEEELTIAYGRPFLSHHERQNELRNYNFKCNCPACQIDTPFGQASESRRLVMKALDEQIIMFQTALNEGPITYGLQDPLSPILRLIELIEEEGLRGELMGPYRGAAELLKGRGKWEEALVFANKELEEERTCLGQDSEVVGKTREYIEELEIMTGKRGLPEEMEMDDLEVQDLETTEHHSKDSHPQKPPPEPSNNPLATHTLEDYPYPKPPSTSPAPSPSPPSPSPSHPNPPLHLTLADKDDSQNTTTPSPAAPKNQKPEPELDPDPSSSAETHEDHPFFEEHTDKDEDPSRNIDSRSSRSRLVRGMGPGT